MVSMQRADYLKRLDQTCRRMSDAVYLNFGHDGNVATTTLICCDLDALGGFYAGKRSTDTTFREFIREYLHVFKEHAFEGEAPRKARVLVPGGKRVEKQYAEILYDEYRNGFAHQSLCKAFTAIQKNEPDEPHMGYFATDYMGFDFVVNLQWLVPDFLLGVERYRSDVHTKDAIFNLFKDRHDAILRGE